MAEIRQGEERNVQNSPSSDTSTGNRFETGPNNWQRPSLLPPPPPRRRESLDLPGEPLKTLASAVFLLFGFVITAFSIVLTHERMPDTDRLPDFILDNLDYVSWGLEASEYLLLVNMGATLALILAHSHRSIILRRLCFLLGLMYTYRALTFFVTSLPKSDPLYHCDPKYRHNNNNETIPFVTMIVRVSRIVAGGGISVFHNQVYCGDFIFSGHTMILVTSYLTLKQYTPDRLFILHWVALAVAIAGVVLLLLGRGHYTVDVIIAYFVTSRLWWIYHTLADSSLKKESNGNWLRGVWWWRIFQFLERNVPGPLPHCYSPPLPRAWTLLIRTQFQLRPCCCCPSCRTQENVTPDLVIVL